MTMGSARSVARACFLIVLPSFAKIWLLRSLGHHVGEQCSIGISFIDADHIHIGDHVRIGHFNVMRRLISLRLDDGSRVTFGNHISGSGRGAFSLGRNSSISMFHFFDASADIAIGANTLIAGRGSQFYSHGITPSDLDYRKQLMIGDWCYIGSAVRFGPGTVIGHHCFVGMGAVAVKDYGHLHYVLIAGSPAVIKKPLPENAAYFDRAFIRHRHHGDDYNG